MRQEGDESPHDLALREKIKNHKSYEGLFKESGLNDIWTFFIAHDFNQLIIYLNHIFIIHFDTK